MNDKPISKGDLVMVVRPTPCCGTNWCGGMIFTISGFCSEAVCPTCGTKFGNFGIVDDCEAIHLERLKRIDPPSLSEYAPADEELTA